MGRRYGYAAIVGLGVALSCTVGARAAGAYGPVLDAPRASLASLPYGVSLAASVPGGYVIGGSFDLADGRLRRGYARVDHGGTLDPNWRVVGVPCLERGACWPRLMFGLADGSVLLCSRAAELGNPEPGGLLRLDPSGRLDPNWRPLVAAGLAAGARNCLRALLSGNRLDVFAGDGERLQISIDVATGAPTSVFRPSWAGGGAVAADARWLYQIAADSRTIERMTRQGELDTAWRVTFPRQPGIAGLDPASHSLIVTQLGDPANTQEWVRVDTRTGAVDPSWSPGISPPHPLNPIHLVDGQLLFLRCEQQHWFNCRLAALPVAEPGALAWQTVLPVAPNARLATVDRAGRVLMVAGTGSDVSPARIVERVLPGGAFDTGFTMRLGTLPRVDAVVSDRGGSVLVGTAIVDGTWTCGSARFDADGAHDTAWTACPQLYASGFITRRGTAFVADGEALLFAGTRWDDTLSYFAFIERTSADSGRFVIADGIRPPPMLPFAYRERINALGHEPERGAVIAGGEFDVPVCGQARRHLVRLADDAYCVLAPAFAPQPDAPVTALARAADGGWYVAGRFGTIGGVATGPLAHLGSDAAGTVSPDFAPLDRIEKAGQVVGPAGLVAAADALYLYGDFDRIDGLPRAGLARVMLADGSLDTAFAPALAGRPLSVLADGRWLDVAVDRGNAGLPATDQVCRVDVVTGGVHHCTDTDGDLTAIVATGRDSVRVAGAYTRIGGVERIGIADLPRTLFADGLE